MTDAEFSQIRITFIQAVMEINRSGFSYTPQPGDRFVFAEDLKKQLEQVINNIPRSTDVGTAAT